MPKPETAEEIRKAKETRLVSMSDRKVFLARCRLFFILFGIFGIPILFVFGLKYVPWLAVKSTPSCLVTYMIPIVVPILKKELLWRTQERPFGQSPKDISPLPYPKLSRTVDIWSNTAVSEEQVHTATSPHHCSGVAHGLWANAYPNPSPASTPNLVQPDYELKRIFWEGQHDKNLATANRTSP